MDLSERVIPALRGDVALEETGEERLPAALVDRSLGQRLKLDGRGAMIASGLTRSWRAGDLLGALEHAGLQVPPALLVRFVRFLDGHLLLDSERARRRVTAVRAAEEAGTAADAPIRFLPGTGHQCVACGASCGGHDIGPIQPSQVDAIRAAVPGAQFVQRKTGSEDTTGMYCAMREDRCVFLRPDRLCSIHASLGEDPKPTDCRVFPLSFTRTPAGILAGVRLECRSFLQSKRNGGALADRAAELAHLASAVDTMGEVPPLVRLDGETTLPYSEYQKLKTDLLGAVTDPVAFRGLLAVNSLCRTRVAAERLADREGQVFPSDSEVPEPGDRTALLDAIQRGCAAAARMNAAAGSLSRAARFDRMGRAAERLRGGPLPPVAWSADDQELLRDHLTQSLFLDDPVVGPHLEFGIGLLNLSVLLAVAAILDEGDLNGALADSLKTLRAGPVRAPLHQADHAVAAWMHHRLEAWVTV